MDVSKLPFLPFFTRNQLDFEHAAAFSLQITSYSNVADTIVIHGFTKSGPFEFTHTTNNTGASSTQQFRLPDIPIMVSLSMDSEARSQGDTYAILDLLLSESKVYELASGWIYTFKGISWPTNSNQDIVPTRGSFRDDLGTNPAANAEVSETVPTNRVWHILAVSVVLVTDANAANRRVHLVFTGPNGFKCDIAAGAVQTATTTIRYSFAQFGSVFTGINDSQLGGFLPADLWLPPASTIKTETANIQATDNYGAPNILVEEFFTEKA